MKNLLPIIALLLQLTGNAQSPVQKIRFGLISSLSYQFAMNGSKAESNMGNMGFKSYIQPEIGLSLKYEQDSTEFALVSVSASRMAYTLSGKNILINGSASYDVYNRFDVYTNNYSMELSYHKRIGQFGPNTRISLECGVGVHYIQRYDQSVSDDTLLGPYAITTLLEFEKDKYFLPSAELGLSMLVKPVTYKAQVLFGLRCNLFLDNFSAINYSSHYSDGTTQHNYDFRWAPTLLVPKVYAAVLF